MRAANPPIVATWLLDRLYTGDERESLIGDLVECYGRSRSAAWYWRQVLAAIVLSFCREVRGHILLAIRAVVTGWLAFFMFRFISLGMLSRFHLHFQLVTHLGSATGVPLTWLIFWSPIWMASGWFLASHHQPQSAFMLLAFSASVLFWHLQGLPWTIRLLFDATTNARFFPQLAFDLMELTLPPICIVLGGLLAGLSVTAPSAQEKQNAT
jgi:hypothetical protein